MEKSNMAKQLFGLVIFLLVLIIAIVLVFVFGLIPTQLNAVQVVLFAIRLVILALLVFFALIGVFIQKQDWLMNLQDVCEDVTKKDNDE